MATLIDVAKKSGFSKTLVARAMNGEPNVGAKSREIILQAARDLNYRPNLLAKALITNKMNTISVVLDSLCEPFYFKLIESIEATARKKGIKVLFCSPNDDIDVKRTYAEYFSQGIADGVIIYGSKIGDEPYIKDLVQYNFPVVIIESKVEDEKVNSVLIDNYGASKKVTNYLIKEGGLRQLYHFMGDMDKCISQDRMQGYIDGMSENGLEDNVTIIQSNFSEDLGYVKMMELIQENTIPDGIFFAGDSTAYGAMRAIAETNIDIFKKIRLFGFDEDIPPNYAYNYPRLSTIRQPMYQIGEVATNMLLRHIADRNMENETKILEPEMVMKET